MGTQTRAECRYEPKFCKFLARHVWAILTLQADGTWRTVNCLDKDEACFNLECAFTTDHGEWPYHTVASGQLQTG